MAVPVLLDVARAAAAEAARPVPRRERFLQLVLEARTVTLADNIDYLFAPAGPAVPGPEGMGERLSAQLDVLESCGELWDRMGDEASRELLLRFLAFRVLGPVHVRLQLDPEEYRGTVLGLSAHALRRPFVLHAPGVPLEWQMHLYDLSALGVPAQVVGQPLPLASTYAFSQYAYRDPAAGARPRPGDVAVDAGGCWGETALWLAHHVGPEGAVHVFEPGPGNRELLEGNLGLNPALAARTTLWHDALSDRAGDVVRMPAVIAAGAAMTTHGEGVEVTTTTIDARVAEGAIPRVDFLKVDVEGADLGVLLGATETLLRDRPRLALACYHRPEDLIAFPELLADLGLDYRWYLQCSTMNDVDTVLFGVPA
ncbi:MAG: FkbM family methyltransferase [Solirubrobacterales bacterium]|nr:FkbM family methyltransferase [Solirubrobacterales bacterium]